MFTAPIGLLNPKVDAIPRNGLILEYLLSNNFLDTSPTGNDGNRTNGLFTTDRHSVTNSAFEFNINLTHILSTSNLSISGNDSRSFSFWIKTAITAVAIFFDTGAASTNNRFTMWYIGNSLRMSLHGNQLIYTSNEVISDAWTHIACTYNGGTLSTILLYINGTIRNYDSLSGSDLVLTTTTSKIQLMNNLAPSSAVQYEGAIDDFRIYDRALTQAEITALYNE